MVSFGQSWLVQEAEEGGEAQEGRIQIAEGISECTEENLNLVLHITEMTELIGTK
jgi:hypothetical protein